MSKSENFYLNLRVLELLSKQMRNEELRDQDKLFKECRVKWPHLGREDFDEMYLLVEYVING